MVVRFLVLHTRQYLWAHFRPDEEMVMRISTYTHVTESFLDRKWILIPLGRTLQQYL